MSTDLVTARELQRRLAVSRRTVARLQERGMPIVRIGRCVRYHLEAVRAWVASQQPAQPRHRGRPRRIVAY